MCTVTFIPGRERIFLTSNRDEKHFRSPALVPGVYEFETGRVVFPKDGDAGGTWIASHENGNAIVFLNGGFVFHQSAPPYRKSRGLILLDLIDSITPYNSFLVINLNNIEPFTAIVWDDQRLFECRWDGRRKHSTELNSNLPHIWSSATLYTEQTISKRKSWFEQWLQKYQSPTAEEIFKFHQFTGDGDQHNDLMMNRDGKVFTVSITQLSVGEEMINMRYLDLKKDQLANFEFPVEKTMASR
jgi:hypothetical protein